MDMPKKAKAPKKMNGQSKQPLEDILSCLKQHAPEAFVEDEIDPKKLQKSLGDLVDSGEERYGINWAGKTDCFREIQQTTSKTLKPNRKESEKFDETGNIFIEGENLQVLKILQNSYYGKIKMIYIDPPYNTGNDFIYDDNYAQTKKEYLKKAGAIDKDGNILEDDLYHRNTRDSGHFHSNWLNMMYPRLYLARNLLRDDGVIFVSIDDNEVHNLRMIMNEIFGEENFRGQAAVKRGVKSVQMQFETIDKLTEAYEYVLIYTKNADHRLPRPEKARIEENAGTWNNHWRGTDRPTMRYELFRQKPKTGQWRWSKDRSLQAILNYKKMRKELGDEPTQVDIDIWWLSQSDSPDLLRLSTTNKPEHYIPPSTSTLLTDLWIDVPVNDKKDVKALFNKEKIFDNPKSIKLLTTCSLLIDKDALILDFFAGSGTTAHAVMQLNADDGGNRKCISVQLPEACDKDSEAYKAGFKNIADIAKERIRRAAKKIKKENKEAKFDDGFKVFKLDDSNFKIWNTQIENQEQLEQQLMDFVDNVQKGVSDENLLYELLVKSGQELNVPIEEKKADKHTYYRIGNGSIIVCLDKITDKLLEAILEDKPKKLIILERTFGGKDQLMTNALLHAKNAGVEDVRIV